MSAPGHVYVTTHVTDRISRLIWAVVLPRRTRKLRITVAGWGVVITGAGLGAAAYNNGSNILFLSLSLLIATLAAGFVLARMNLRRLRAELLVPEHFIAREATVVRVRIRNERRRLPAYALRVDVSDSQTSRTGELFLSDAIAPGDHLDYPWEVVPSRRGVLVLRIECLRSSHPFGLLDIAFGGATVKKLPVRPAPVPYVFDEYEGRKLAERGRRLRRGDGGDTAYLRAYRVGDAMRSIHWRASAKRGSLLVREHESNEDHAYSLRLDPVNFAPDRSAAFEKACSLVATLAGDFHRQGRLASTALGDEPEVSARRSEDLNLFLDRLATVTLGEVRAVDVTPRFDTLTFHPGPGDIVHVRLQNRLVGEA